MPSRNILVINCGSSSIKFALVNEEQPDFILSGLAERLASPEAVLHWQHNGEKDSLLLQGGDHRTALQHLLPLVQNATGGQLHGIGHRVVHGGEHFTAACRIDTVSLLAIRATSPLAPLHNPANLQGIEAALKLFPELPQVAVFDTAFHQSLPEHAYRYAVPEQLYREHGVRRYGFHGTSHRYVAAQAHTLLGLSPDDSGLVIAHLGNGASICAVRNGQSVDTSMGMTPLEGLMMGTRCGDVDFGAMAWIAQQTGQSFEDLERVVNKESGLLGISGISSDLRALEKAWHAGNERAQLAIQTFVHRIARHIAGHAASLHRLDGLIFTGGIGENSARARSAICHNLNFLGLSVDEEKNQHNATLIQAENAMVKVAVIKTNEELMIARDVMRLALPQARELAVPA